MPANDQGVSFDRYMLVPRTLVFLTLGEQVLLLKGAGNKRLWAGLYNGIGGHIEPGEDALSAARREMVEETGLSIDELWLCGIVTVDTQTNPGVGIFVFKGECREYPDITPSEGTLEWHAFADIQNLPLVADLPAILAKIQAYQPGMPPFFAHSSYDASGNLVIHFG